MLSDRSRKFVSRVYRQTDTQTHRHTHTHTDKASVYILAALRRGEKTNQNEKIYKKLISVDEHVYVATAGKC